MLSKFTIHNIVNESFLLNDYIVVCSNTVAGKVWLHQKLIYY